MNNYIDHLIDVMDNIELHKVTVLTGRNGGGKSMIRKLLQQFLKTKPELKDKGGNIVASISMDRRAGVDASLGGCQIFNRDLEWLPTSENTLHSIEEILQESNRYLILDEIELGMGEELQAGLAIHLNSKLKDALSRNLGIMIITHSRTMVKYLDKDVFINLEGMTEDEWLNREIKPVSPDELKKKSDDLYKAFQRRLRPAK